MKFTFGCFHSKRASLFLLISSELLEAFSSTTFFFGGA